MSRQGQLSIERMCYLAQVSRAGFYRSLRAHQPVDEEMDVRSAIQGIAVAHRRRYGYRRITAELRRRGLLVNHKRVVRLMREDNLLAVQPRAFVVTTDAAHDFEVFLNLARRMKMTGINQLWVADITYIRLEEEFVYLAVILDAYSKRVIGWHLDDGLDDSLTLTALRMDLDWMADRLPAEMQPLREKRSAMVKLVEAAVAAQDDPKIGRPRVVRAVMTGNRLQLCRRLGKRSRRRFGTHIASAAVP